jgi:hypothetical protein
MPCPEYDGLQAMWEDALQQDVLALHPEPSTVRNMSAAQLSEHRVNARRDLLKIEDKRNSHIRDCAVCQREDRPILDSSEVHE